ncbi:zf-HC2 domain-containing protein [Saccharopolyspora shandongensis]|uniref:zf-HC2 domain-containing protein n=1 Tax=Saccharopolyspora shandongensis TaxID=418495 RepID=UPI0034302256
MDCYTYREALSARLDGEPAPVPDNQLEGHLAECAGCRSWQQRAADLNRALRVRPVEATPDLTRSILDAARPMHHHILRRWPRILLAAVAICQVVLGAAQMLGIDYFGDHAHHAGMGDVMTGHLLNESTAWNLALGLGMLWTAWRVRASSGLLPVMAVFLAVLSGFSIYDLVNAEVPASRLLSHGLLVLGLVLLLVVQRDLLRWRPQPGDEQAPHPHSTTTAHQPAEPEFSPDPEQDHRYLGPTGYRQAG